MIVRIKYDPVPLQMAKMILRCSSKMANEVVLGELGWWTLKGRRDFLILNYWKDSGRDVTSPSCLSRYDNSHNNRQMAMV